MTQHFSINTMSLQTKGSLPLTKYWLYHITYDLTYATSPGIEILEKTTTLLRIRMWKNVT